MSRPLRFAIFLLLSVPASGTSAEDLTCLNADQRTAANLYAHFQQQAYAALDRRMQGYEQLKTAKQIVPYQQKLRAFFLQQLGGLPERTPLHAERTKVIQAAGYRIENVIFQSQPNHHVTANLYLPQAAAPVPGVVVSSGHSRTGKTADYNQRFGIMLAQHGIAALCFDPIGQGERSQLLASSGEPQFQSTTTEHFLLGVGSILVGRNTARYRIWDALRSIDYLASRREVDPQRIGFTGCSGGGTLTSYVMALDERVLCAAPACYLTTFRRLVETIGPQDAEQNIFGQIAFGLDQPDYILMRAPRPTLISSTTNDFFDIQGSWHNYRQAKRIYARLGYPERVDLVEVEGNHGVHPQNLATITHWMKRWLRGEDEAVPISEIPVRPEADLLCTTSGQVLTSLPGERSVIDLNREYASTLSQQREKHGPATTPNELLKQIRNLIGVRPNSKLKPPAWQDLGRVQRDDYHIDKLLLTTDSGIPLPALTFHPPSPVDAAYLYLHDEGKLGDSAEGQAIEEIVDSGYAVVSVDLRGQGETGTEKRDPVLTDWKTYYLGYLLGQSLVGLRVEDALAAADFVAYYQKNRNKPREVHLVAVGQAGIVALHAAALQPQLFTSITLRKTPRSWSEIVGKPVPSGQLDSTVHGVLATYDLPDLVRLIGKNPAGQDKVRFED